MLEIPVELTAEKGSEFLEYLRASLEAAGRITGSEGGYEEDGRFITSLKIVTEPEPQREIPVRWTVTQNTDGSLDPIVVDGPSELDARLWESVATDIVRRALNAARNEQRGLFFRRHPFACFGLPLDGEYWISDWRFAPVFPNEETGGLLHQPERVVYLDHNVAAIDDQHASSIAAARASRFASVLSVILDIGLESPQLETRWVMLDRDHSEKKSLGFLDPRRYGTRMPEQGEACSLGVYETVDRDNLQTLDWDITTTTLKMPSDASELIHGLNSLPPDDQEAFYGASGLYRISLTAGRKYLSVRMAYQVAAVDALVSGYSTTEKFIDLVGAYCSEAPHELSRRLYGYVRSRHLHDGIFPGGEYDPQTIRSVFDHAHIERFDLRRQAYVVARTVLIRWLRHKSGLTS